MEDVTVFEEPALAPLVKVVDPEAAEPTPVVLETDWNSNVVGYRTEPVQKQRDERKVQLVIARNIPKKV